MISERRAAEPFRIPISRRIISHSNSEAKYDCALISPAAGFRSCQRGLRAAAGFRNCPRGLPAAFRI